MDNHSFPVCTCYHEANGGIGRISNKSQVCPVNMINYIPPSFYEDLFARDGPVGCNGGDCDVNGTQVLDNAQGQWDKLSQGAKVGIIVGAAVGGTLLFSILGCCLCRCYRKRRNA